MSRSIMISFLLVIFLVFVDMAIGRSLVNQPLSHSRKSIKSEDGDIVDCVDIHNQPSLQHPLLKNHVIQMAPTEISSLKSEYTSSEQKQLQQSWHKSGYCPEGTVPILRSTSNVKALTNAPQSYDAPRPDIENNNILNYSNIIINAAVGYVYDAINGPFYGGIGNMSVWNIFVDDQEYSKNYILAADISNVDDVPTLEKMDITNFVAAGWLVDPVTFGNQCPRVYVEWRTGDGGCYNLLCSGFIQISKNIVLGGIISNVSTFNDPNKLQAFDVKVYQEPDKGNWWVDINDEMVGYWPDNIFNDNFTQAEVMVFGGEILNKGEIGKHTSTQMGSGNMPSELQQYGRAADISGIVVREKDNTYHNHSLQYFATYNNCYNYYNGTQGPLDNGSLLYYGGSGGATCDGVAA